MAELHGECGQNLVESQDRRINNPEYQLGHNLSDGDVYLVHALITYILTEGKGEIRLFHGLCHEVLATDKEVTDTEDVLGDVHHGAALDGQRKAIHRAGARSTKHAITLND